MHRSINPIREIKIISVNMEKKLIIAFCLKIRNKENFLKKYIKLKAKIMVNGEKVTVFKKLETIITILLHSIVLEVLTNKIRHELERRGINTEKEAAQSHFQCYIIAFIGKPTEKLLELIRI